VPPVAAPLGLAVPDQPQLRVALVCHAAMVS
jgi:hypothetical protein